MKTIVAALHGILTNQTDPSWPDKLDAWMFAREPELKVLKKEYRAGPFPRWNCWVKDPGLARSLANEIELFLESASGVADENSPQVWFVAHSNGAVIALLAARRIIERGHRVAGLIFTGAACEADIERNGILDWQCRGQLGVAIAYCSADDAVLDGDPAHEPTRRAPWFHRIGSWLLGKALWPYGCLGRTGWLLGGRPFETQAFASARIQTRWFSGGHSTYFARQNIGRTFEQIYLDIKESRVFRTNRRAEFHEALIMRSTNGCESFFGPRGARPSDQNDENNSWGSRSSPLRPERRE